MASTGILIVLALVLLTLAVTTWGSIGSVVMIFCLLLMAAALLYQRFLTNREDDDWQTE